MLRATIRLFGMLTRVSGRLQQVAQLFARLESDRVTGRDLHLDAGLRIAADSLLALLDLKHAEAAQLDALTARQRVAQSFDHSIDGLGCFHPRNFGDFRYLVDDVRLDHLTPEGLGLYT